MSGDHYGARLSRALRLRCPRCGVGRLFRGWFSMHVRCSECGFVFERAPGYFLGATYLNYGFLSLTVTALYMGLHYGIGFSNRQLAAPLTIYLTLTGLFLFRYARSFWLAMDSYYDPVGFREEPVIRDEPPPASGDSAARP